LHFAPGCAESAGFLTRQGKEQLIDDDVMSVYAALCQLLHQALRLVEREELGDAHADKSCLIGIAELLVHLFYYLEHLFHFAGERLRVEISKSQH